MSFAEKPEKLKTDTITDLKKSKEIVLTESKAYKMLYENQVKANDAVLKTIFYALGGLGTAVLLVFGSNWWFNDKKVKEAMSEIDAKIAGVKKDALSEFTEKISTLTTENISEMNQTQIKLQEDVTSNITQLNLKFNEFIDKTRTEIKDDNRINLTTYQELLKIYNENTTQQVNSIKDSYEEKIKNITTKIEDNEKKYEAKLSSQSKNFKKELLEHNAQIAFLKGNYNIALKAFLDQAHYEFEIGYTSHFQYTARDIVKCLEKVTFIYDDEEKSLNELMELSVKDDEANTNKIKSLYVDKEVKQLNP
jgi:hypothetical protein